MTSVEIKENNKLIAEFLGYKYFGFDRSKVGVKPGWKFHDNPISLKIQEDGIVGQRHYLCRGHNDLRFYNSWNWIMPVVERIERVGFKSCIEEFTDKEHRCFFFPKIDSGHFFDKSFPGGERGANKLKATYMAVVQFIKWYNNKM